MEFKDYYKNYRLRCSTCGKFRKLEQLTFDYIPDSEYTVEAGWYECDFCKAKEEDNGV